jgi:arginyl-tRNA synthetase
MQKYREQWQNAAGAAVMNLLRQSGRADKPPVPTPETPPSPEMGDIAFPMFPFAKALRKSPAAIAEEVARAINEAGAPGGRAEAAGPYVNIRLDRPSVVSDILDTIETEGGRFGSLQDLAGERIMVEFSCPNTNKPLHIGHLRNDALGESISRLLRKAGAEVLKVNLINDRGVHICKSMLAYKMFGGSATPQSKGMKGDHFVGDYYVKYSNYAKDNPEAEEQIREYLRKWEEGDAETLQLWRTMNEWVISGHAETYKRTGVSFDMVYLESAVYMTGKAEVLAGIKKGMFHREADGSVWVDLTDKGLDKEVLLRADGTSLYLTQDIGTAIKRAREWPFDRLIYVVASEQRYHFRVLFEVLKLLGFPWAGDLHHLSYGMVNLPEGKMKSREGTVVDADDLLDELEGLAAEEIRNKEREEDVGDLSKTTRDIALGALNYWLLQTTPVKDMTFDPKESLSFNGNTGPYAQYTGARISSILRKFLERREAFKNGAYTAQALSLPEEWEILTSLAKYPDAVRAAARDYNPSILAGYVFDLCKSFSRYYQDHPILRNTDADLVVSRIRLVKAVLAVIVNAFTLLGIPFLEAM